VCLSLSVCFSFSVLHKLNRQRETAIGCNYWPGWDGFALSHHHEESERRGMKRIETTDRELVKQMAEKLGAHRGGCGQFVSLGDTWSEQTYDFGAIRSIINRKNQRRWIIWDKRDDPRGTMKAFRTARKVLSRNSNDMDRAQDETDDTLRLTNDHSGTIRGSAARYWGAVLMHLIRIENKELAK